MVIFKNVSLHMYVVAEAQGNALDITGFMMEMLQTFDVVVHNLHHRLVVQSDKLDKNCDS